MNTLVEDEELKRLRAMAEGSKPIAPSGLWERLAALDLREIRRLPARRFQIHASMMHHGRAGCDLLAGRLISRGVPTVRRRTGRPMRVRNCLRKARALSCDARPQAEV